MLTRSKIASSSLIERLWRRLSHTTYPNGYRYNTNFLECGDGEPHYAGFNLECENFVIFEDGKVKVYIDDDAQTFICNSASEHLVSQFRCDDNGYTNWNIHIYRGDLSLYSDWFIWEYWERIVWYAFDYSIQENRWMMYDLPVDMSIKKMGIPGVVKPDYYPDIKYFSDLTYHHDKSFVFDMEMSSDKEPIDFERRNAAMIVV